MTIGFFFDFMPRVFSKFGNDQALGTIVDPAELYMCRCGEYDIGSSGRVVEGKDERSDILKIKQYLQLGSEKKGKHIKQTNKQTPRKEADSKLEQSNKQTTTNLP